MTDKITLELTLEELKLIDKYVELNDETQSVFDKIKYAYPQLKMTFQQEGDYVVVSYNNTTYYRFMGEDSTCFSWYIKKGVNANYPTPTLVMIIDGETERLLEGLYYNDVVVKKEKVQRQTKSPVEEAYKDWWGIYPELENDTEYDDTRWQGFQAGYEFAYAISTAKEVMEKVQEEQKWDVVRESVKWCKENPDKDPLDWLKPQTPEETERGMRTAFREAQQTEKWKEIQKLIDEEDNDKNFKNSLDLIKEWGEKNKPPTLKELVWEWWEDIFTVDADLDADASIDVLVDKIAKEFLPPSSDRNSYEWEKCLKMMRGNLR
jgi:hypothetical protein